jgi:hypothetical protein
VLGRAVMTTLGLTIAREQRYDIVTADGEFHEALLGTGRTSPRSLRCRIRGQSAAGRPAFRQVFPYCARDANVQTACRGRRHRPLYCRRIGACGRNLRPVQCGIVSVTTHVR